MARVFLSSTGADLSAYRQAAIETCLALGLFPVAMEHFEVEGSGAADASTAKLDTCDVYVGVFAHRYGTVDVARGVSIVEHEYDHAGARGVERLCFLVDDEHPWPPSSVDHEHHAALAAFKERVEGEVVRGRFTTVSDFRAQLTTALVAWKDAHGVSADPAASAPAAAGALPPMPSLVLGRTAVLGELRGLLLGGNEDAPALVAVRGWPGVGKTTVASALAHDAELARGFPDGVLWVSLGKAPNVAQLLGGWGRALGLSEDVLRGLPADELNRHLCARLRDERRLLIIDDVWDVREAAPFRVGGRRAAQLFTTRLQSVARELVATEEQLYLLPCFDEADSLALLRLLAPRAVELAPDKTAELVVALEGLPLALRVAGSLLQAEAASGFSIEQLLDELREGAALLSSEAPAADLDLAEGARPTVSVLLRRSTDHLDDELRDAFAFLGAFAPKPATFTLEAMARVWGVPDPRPAARALIARGLLEPIPETGRYQMHALLAMHARSLIEED
ncbi:MAG: NB-ARC domain-containing protein [Planctomycetota bacterium]